jgi:uncharacterized protein YbaR (Trm112 family)
MEHGMQTYLIEMLACPVCHGELDWRIAECSGDRIERAEAHCAACSAIYPVREGIGLFLTPDLPRDDLWEEMDSHLSDHLRQHPEIEQRLLHVPLASLALADQFFRSLILDERGEVLQARIAADMALSGLYTPEYLDCSERQIEYALEYLSSSYDAIVDLASGMGSLVERVARKLSRPIVATDFSPCVLRRDRRRLSSFGLYDRVSLLALDARRTPFKDGAIKTLTTCQGLSNIREPGALLAELRRIVCGSFLALSIFFPEGDEANVAAIRAMGPSDLHFRHSALASFAHAGWQTEVVHSCLGRAQPTPKGVVLEGAGIDASPVAETTLEWCVILASVTLNTGRSTG